MGESAPAFQLYVRDWIVSTASLTDEQSGAYMRLLCHAWEANGLPVEEDEIKQLGRWTDEQWNRIWPKVKTKWHKRGSRLINPRQELERDGLKRYREASAKGGRRSAEVRLAQKVSQGRLKGTCTTVERPLQAKGNTASALASSIKTTTTREPVRPSVVPFDPTAYSPGQLRATIVGLVGAWNNVAAAHPPLIAVAPGATSPNLSRALGNHPDIAWWADVFKAITESDYLMGRDGKNPPITLWKAADKADEIASGKYRNRPEPAERPNAPYVRQAPIYPNYKDVIAKENAIAAARDAEYLLQEARDAAAKAGTH